MQLFSSYHTLSWAIVSVALIALMGFYVASRKLSLNGEKAFWLLLLGYLA